MSKALGADCGTMFFQTAEYTTDGSIKTKCVRNAFVELALNEDTEDILKNNNWQYVTDGKAAYILGEDSIKVAQMLPGKVELRRPLESGVLNAGEEKKMLVLAELVKSAVGKAPDKQSILCTCVSSEAVDQKSDNTFHTARLKGIFSLQGWNVKVIDEGMAVIYAENPKMDDEDGIVSNFSGIGISFGAGRVNCVLARKGMQLVGMSATRSGDWIDSQVAQQTGTALAQVTTIKEKKLDFNNVDYDNDVIFALDAYYGAMIEYVFSMFARKFQKEKPSIDRPLDIVVAGGTSMPKGFINKLESVVRELDLPFQIREIRLSSDPRNAVVKGCLAYAAAQVKKINASKPTEEKAQEPAKIDIPQSIAETANATPPLAEKPKSNNDLLNDLL